jgi:hypothetical protein
VSEAPQSFLASYDRTAKNDRCFFPTTADISSEDSSASRIQQQKRSENVVFCGVKEWNRDCSYLTARGN